MHVSKPVPGKTQKADDLEKLDIWCASMIQMIQIMEESIEGKYMTKRRKEMVKAEIMGIDKVRGQIRKIKREQQSSR